MVARELGQWKIKVNMEKKVEAMNLTNVVF